MMQATHFRGGSVRPFLLSALAAAVLLLSFGSAQSGDSLEYVDHIALEFEHNTMTSTNIALHYRDMYGDLQSPPTGAANGTGLFYLFSTRDIHTLSYEKTGASDWFPGAITFGADITLTSGTEVSYTPIATGFAPPNNGPDTLYDRVVTMTGSRNALYLFEVLSRVRYNTNTLITDPSGPAFTPGNALLATGLHTSLLTTNGGIYTADSREVNDLLQVMVKPLVTAQGAGPGELSNPSALSVGPDGLLYVLDVGNNRIQKFDLETGAHRGGFSLPAGMSVISTSVEYRDGQLHYLADGTDVLSTSMAITAEGRIYLGDGLGGGFVFNLDGDLLSNFHAPADAPGWVDGGLVSPTANGPQVGAGSFLQYDGMGNVFTYVEGKGVFMYRDTSYDELDYVNLTLEGALTSDANSSLVNTLTFGDPVSHEPGTLTIVDPVTVRTGRIFVGVGSTGLVEGGTILTDGDVTKINKGTLILNNENTYMGKTIIDDGTLIVNGAIAGDAVVTDNAVLGGSGVIGGAVTVQSGGTLSPGNSPGQLTVEENLTMEDGSFLIMEIGGMTAGLYDQLDVHGTFMAGGTLNLLLIDDFAPEYGASFTIFNGLTAGYEQGSFDIVTNLVGGLYWDTSALGSSGVVSVVPEPGTCALLALGLGALLVRRRKTSSHPSPGAR